MHPAMTEECILPRRRNDAFELADQTKKALPCHWCDGKGRTTHLPLSFPLMAVTVIVIVTLGPCYGFSTRTQVPDFGVFHQSTHRSLPRRREKTMVSWGEGRFVLATTASETTTLKARKNNRDEEETESNRVFFRQAHREQDNRRRFVSKFLFSTASLVSVSARRPSIASAEPGSSTRIVRLSSGLQFSDQRVGSGPPIQITGGLSSSSSTASNKIEGLEPDDPTVVLMHLKALRWDGSVLLDTFEEGKPLLFQLGSIPSEMYYLNEAGAISKGKIPLGVQDAILAQGAASWEGGFGKADPMRTGGIRKVVIPPELAYGTKGVSRYEAYKLGLNHPVGRNELLRYEIELLRCNDEVIDLGGGNPSDGVEMVNDDGSKSSAVAARACCLEEFYPCQMGG